MMTFTVEHEQEEDGRWLAEVSELPGVLAYARTSDEAIAKRSPYACSPTGWSMARRLTDSSTSPSPRHEPVAVRKS